MKDSTIILTEQLLSKEAPNREVIRQAVTAWLKNELHK